MYCENGIKGTGEKDGKAEEAGNRTALGGSVTLEASLVFPLILALILAVIRFGYYIHDITVSGMLKEYEKVKETGMLWSSYDPFIKEISLKEIANKQLIDFGGIYQEAKRYYLENVIAEYRDSILMGEYAPEAYEGVYSGLKNSTVVRGVHILMTHGERLLKGGPYD